MGLVIYGVLIFIIFPIVYLGFKAHNSETVDSALGSFFGKILDVVLKLPWPLQIPIYILFIYLLFGGAWCAFTLTFACPPPWSWLGFSGWGFNLW